MNKQILNIGDKNLIYIAGLFDGEGHVSIPISKRRGQTPQYWLQIGITNRDKNLLENVQKILGVGHINIDERKDNPTKARICYRWIANSQEAAKVLTKILPYLRTKRKQAELGIMFQSKLVRRQFRYNPLTEGELYERQRMKEKLENLNSL